MKLQSSLLTALLIGASFMAYSQVSDEETDAMVNLLGVQKKEAMNQLVAVSGKDSAAFWKLYDEYQKWNKEAAKSKIKLYEQTAKAYNNMTAANAESLANKYFAARMEEEKKLQEYFKKIKEATNPVIAFQFYQAETFLSTSIRASIMEEVPTYGELVKYGKKSQ
jgi:glycerol-3-phosphate dehydrogenase